MVKVDIYLCSVYPSDLQLVQHEVFGLGGHVAGGPIIPIIMVGAALPQTLNK